MALDDTLIADPAQQQAYRTAAQQLQSGRSTTNAVLTLTSAGVNEKDATDFVIAANKRIREAKSKRANKNILPHRRAPKGRKRSCDRGRLVETSLTPAGCG